MTYLRRTRNVLSRYGKLSESFDSALGEYSVEYRMPTMMIIVFNSKREDAYHRLSDFLIQTLSDKDTNARKDV